MYGNSTSQPIVFIVGMKTRRKNGTEYPWGVLGNVNMSLTALFIFDFSKCKNNNNKQTNKQTHLTNKQTNKHPYTKHTKIILNNPHKKQPPQKKEKKKENPTL